MKLRLLILFFTLITFNKLLLAQSNSDSSNNFLYKRYFHKDPSLLLLKSRVVANPFAITDQSKKDNIVGLTDLNRSGSISRAITIGNNQDLSVSSSLNLQMSGRLSDDLEIIAAISDDNIPIQPEGNTQQIQEFDRVFIQLINPNYSIIAGDYELRKPNSYFLNYLKKVKGAMVSTQYNFDNGFITRNSASIAIAKGKYNRMVILGREGNQGPYRLTGLYNEQFIIVLAGTERVYLDGILLKRGDNEDYTIDYNTAEIIFSPKRLITAYSRITIEFEYSDRNYSRTLTTISTEQKYKTWAFRFNYYNEQDSKNRPLLQELNDDKKRFIGSQAYRENNGYYLSEDSVGFDNSEVRYQKVDSSGQTIYIYSTNPENAIYKINFTEFGANKGNYVLDQTLANGRVFKWVSPIGGVAQGTHEPVVFLVAPRKNSYYTFAVDKSFKNLFISNETSISDLDDNLFLKGGNQQSLANKTAITHTKNLKKDSINNYQLKNIAQLEITSADFKFLEYYRPQEFNREFALDPNTIFKGNQIWLSYLTSYENNNKPILQYKFSTFRSADVYSAIQNLINTDLILGKYKFNGSASINIVDASKFDQSKSDFLKHRFDFSRSLKYFNIGIFEETEMNISKSSLNDSLRIASFAFRDYRIYINNKEGKLNKYRLEYSNRLDQLPFNNSLLASTRAQGIGLITEFTKNQNSIISINYNYRQLEVYRTRTNLQSENNNLLRVNHDARIKNGLLVVNTFYELNTGQEPKRSFTYIQVPAGQGVYIHRDYNNNGIKELNEFEIAKFSYEADYIRITLNNNDFVRTKGTAISQNILLDPQRIFTNTTGIKKFIANFSNQLNYKIEKKTLFNSKENNFNPFDITINDTSLITLNTLFRESIFFKRTDPVFGAEYTYQNNSAKLLLSLGFDSRTTYEHIIRTRWNILAKYSINVEAKVFEKNSTNESASDRNYNLDALSVSPEFAIQYDASWRLAFIYKYQNIENKIAGRERANQNKLGTQLKYNSGGKTSLTAALNYINNDYIGNQNSAIAYEILEALQPGKNYTWTANWQRNISETFQFSFIYEGRSSESSKVIHSGSMQARAFF
jgi:hypothetical protein